MGDQRRSNWARGLFAFRLCASALAALSLAILPAPAAAQRNKGNVGGSGGGRYFEYDCGAGRLLVGLRGSAGVLIDNIQAICARYDAAGGLVEPTPQGPTFGNRRPFDQSAECPPQYAVIGGTIILNNDHPFVGSINIVCQEVKNRRFGGTHTTGIRGGGNLAGYTSDFLVFSGDPGGQSWWHRDQSECEGYAAGIHGREGRHLSAFGLICGNPEVAQPAGAPAAAPTLDPAFASLLNSESSFQTFNFPDRFIRHMNWLGWVEPSHGNYGSIIYRMVPGLGGRCISLESKDHPGHFLRHKDWRIRLSKLDSDPNMRADATFCPTPGLASTTGISFEAVSAPGHFIRHRNFELWLDRPDGSDQMRNDTTFLATAPGGAALGVR